MLKYGSIIYEFHSDADGKGVVDDKGSAGYECRRNFRGWILYKTWLGEDRQPVNRWDNGVASVKREYDSKGHMIKEEYFDASGEPTLCNGGYAVSLYGYDGDRQITGAYLDVKGQPADANRDGYARYVIEYRDDGELGLTYFYNSCDELVRCGSSNLHTYLRSLVGKDFIISVKDEATNSLPKTIVEDMMDLGLEIDLRGHYRESYLAVVANGGVVENIGKEMLTYHDVVAGKHIEVVSAGNDAGSFSSIKIDDIEYSKNTRGLNIVVLDHGEVVDSVAFDTFFLDMHETR